MDRTSVLLVEDDNLTRSTLVPALGNLGLHFPQPASDFNQAVESFRTHQHDALLTDLDLGSGPSGLDLAHYLRKSAPRLGVVFLTSFEDPRLLRDSSAKLPSGSKYLVKQSLMSPDQIASAISAAIASRSRPFPETDYPFLDHFSPVQLETLTLVAKGLSNAEIAQRRGVSVKAVEKTVRLIAEDLRLAPDSPSNLRVSMARAYMRLTGGKG